MANTTSFLVLIIVTSSFTVECGFLKFGTKNINGELGVFFDCAFHLENHEHLSELRMSQNGRVFYLINRKNNYLAKFHKLPGMGFIEEHSYGKVVIHDPPSGEYVCATTFAGPKGFSSASKSFTFNTSQPNRPPVTSIISVIVFNLILKMINKF